MTPDLNPENDALLMATAKAIFNAIFETQYDRASVSAVISILAEYHRALREQNAVLRAQVEELVRLQPPAPIVVQKEGR